MATVESITRDEIADFFHHWYRPATMVVTAAGRLEHDAGRGRRRGRPRRRRRRRAARCARRRRRRVATTIVERDDTEQAHLCLGWRSLSTGDDDRWAMSVANQVLGGGMASRLFQEVREERGLAYSVYSHPTAFEDSGYLTIYCGTAPKRAREALEVIDDVVAAVLADGVTEAELAVAAGYLEGSMLLGLEDSGGRMGRLGRSLMQRDQIITDRRARRAPPGRHRRRRRRVLHRVLDTPRALAAVGPFEVDELVG